MTLNFFCHFKFKKTYLLNTVTNDRIKRDLFIFHNFYFLIFNLFFFEKIKLEIIMSFCHSKEDYTRFLNDIIVTGQVTGPMTR